MVHKSAKNTWGSYAFWKVLEIGQGVFHAGPWNIKFSDFGGKVMEIYVLAVNKIKCMKELFCFPII
jgi:hypothetical protein